MRTEHVIDQGGGGKQYEYSQKGVLSDLSGKNHADRGLQALSVLSKRAHWRTAQDCLHFTANDAKDVDPATTEVTVTFDRDMSASFTWNGDGPGFPSYRGPCILAGSANLRPAGEVGARPRLPHWIEHVQPNYQSFRSVKGARAMPMTIRFSTRGTNLTKATKPRRARLSRRKSNRIPVVMEGIGWDSFRLGATREELVKAMVSPIRTPIHRSLG